jgi:hypothetical protein
MGDYGRVSMSELPQPQQTSKPGRSLRKQLSLRKKVLFSLICTSVAAGLGYVVVLTVLSEQLYRYVTSSQRGIQGKVHRADDELGFSAIPGASGADVFPSGPPVPIRIDQHGFRVCVEERTVAADAETLLALGCSFTFGAACEAKDTFVERVGDGRAMRVHNAGGSGYGLVQMLRLARRHVSTIRPDVLLVQFAPWLIARARNNMAPSYHGRLPVPYFAATTTDSLDIQGPVFRAKVVDLPLSEYRRPDAGGRLSFYWSCGFPLYVHDHWGFAISKLSGWPPPELDRCKVVRLCYSEFARLGREAGARVLVVMLGDEERGAREELQKIEGLQIVDAERALRGALGKHTQSDYQLAYGHWRGEPPQLLDTHPNAVAHGRIAEAILQALSR